MQELMLKGRAKVESSRIKKSSVISNGNDTRIHTRGRAGGYPDVNFPRHVIRAQDAAVGAVCSRRNQDLSAKSRRRRTKNELWYPWNDGKLRIEIVYRGVGSVRDLRAGEGRRTEAPGRGDIHVNSLAGAREQRIERGDREERIWSLACAKINRRRSVGTPSAPQWLVSGRLACTGARLRMNFHDRIGVAENVD